MKKYIFIILFLFGIKTFALLPPLYQSIKEIDEIILDERVQKELTSAEPILEIKKVKNGYVLITNRYSLFVEVKYIPQEMMGPAKYELQVHEKEIKDFCDTQKD